MVRLQIAIAFTAIGVFTGTAGFAQDDARLKTDNSVLIDNSTQAELVEIRLLPKNFFRRGGEAADEVKEALVDEIRKAAEATLGMDNEKLEAMALLRMELIPVSMIQLALYEHDEKITRIDGDYGAETAKAVKSIQGKQRVFDPVEYHNRNLAENGWLSHRQARTIICTAATERSRTKSKINLGIMYATGIGFPQNLDIAEHILGTLASSLRTSKSEARDAALKRSAEIDLANIAAIRAAIAISRPPNSPALDGKRYSDKEICPDFRSYYSQHNTNFVSALAKLYGSPSTTPEAVAVNFDTND